MSSRRQGVLENIPYIFHDHRLDIARFSPTGLLEICCYTVSRTLCYNTKSATKMNFSAARETTLKQRMATCFRAG
jgi:hypothetical protein